LRGSGRGSRWGLKGTPSGPGVGPPTLRQRPAPRLRPRSGLRRGGPAQLPDAIKASDEFQEYVALRYNAGCLLAGDAKGPGRALWDGCAPGLWPEPGRRYETHARGQPQHPGCSKVRWVAGKWRQLVDGKNFFLKRGSFQEKYFLKMAGFSDNMIRTYAVAFLLPAGLPFSAKHIG